MKTTNQTLVVVGVALVSGALFQLQGAPVQWSGNGHWYELVSDPGITWDAANATAGGLSYNGLQGYLTTITTPAEDAFVLALINNTAAGQYYAGGYQDAGVEPANVGWKWVTGEAWSYSNWYGGEPNDAYGPASEQWLGIGWQGWYWNDEAALGNIAGYVVEYGAVPDQGSVLSLFGLALLGLGVIRRYTR